MNKNDILKALAQHQPHEQPETQFAAAVLVILLEEHNQFEIVLTKRAAHLPTYAGDYSLPGGFKETSDANLYQTAIRETQEELSLPIESYRFIGQLDDFMSHDGRLVRPFMVQMKKSDFEKMAKKSDVEIDEIYYFALYNLPNIIDEPLLHAITLRRPSYAFSEGNVFVWGLTASILVHLGNIIKGEKKPLGKKI